MAYFTQSYRFVSWVIIEYAASTRVVKMDLSPGKD